MFRATVRKVHALGDVSVSIDGRYGNSLIRVKSRVVVDVGERVFVEDVSPIRRAHDWVLFGKLTEIGQWATPAPHTHPVGQVTGLVDWLTKYEAWMGDHGKRMEDAEKRLTAGEAAVADARAVLAETRTDLADAVKRVAVQETVLGKVGARLDQSERDIKASGDRIGANEAAIQDASTRLESAVTAVQKNSTDLTAVSGRLDTTAKDLTTLQGTVGDVQSKAAASEQKAADALAKAGAAQVSADGKNRITRATSPASQPGTAVGDTHFTMSSMGGGGLVLRQQRWDGSTWQDEALSHQVLASLDLGKATVGELDGGRIKANTVTADRLLVGIGDNLAPDPFFQAPAAWTTPAWVDPKAAGYRTTGALVLPASTSQRGAYMTTRGALPASRRARFSVWVKSATPLAVNDIRVYSRAYKQDGTWVFMTPSFVGNTGPIPAGTWARVVGEFAGPEDGATFTVGMFAQPSTGTVAFSEFQMNGLTEGALIVQGSITGTQIEGESVAAKIGQFVKVQAQNVEVTGELAARVVQAMNTATKNLVVTESAVLQHTTLLGTTVADQINVRKLLRGRDAILDGTVDVNQLNVTGNMSATIIRASDISARRAFFTEGLTAENSTLLGQTVADNLVVSDSFAARVVNAMSTNTKQLVVTDDAILNRATIVQSLVTPELIASKVDARYLRADAISTANLEVLGRFRTAPMGQPQIIIQPSQSSWNNKDLAVWFTPDGGTPGGGYAESFAVTGGMWMNPTPDTGDAWSPKTLNLRGQSRAGVRVMDALIVDSTNANIGPLINAPMGKSLTVLGNTGLRLHAASGGIVVDGGSTLEASAVDGMATFLGKTARLVSNTKTEIYATAGDIYADCAGEARFLTGPDGVRFTSKNGNSWQYNVTASGAANMYIDGNGKVCRSTSSRRYKKFISDASIDPDGIMRLRLRKWRDRKVDGVDEDMKYYRGAIAEEVAEIFPEFVPTIPDPDCVDESGIPLGDAPLVPDSIEYDRLGLFVAVTGYQNLRPRLDGLEDRLSALEGK